MNHDNIKTVLSYCKFDTKYFEVSRTFEWIYFQQIYNCPKIAGKRIYKACYEQEHEFINLLKTRDIECSLYDFWSRNISTEKKILIYWNSLHRRRFNTFDDVIKNDIPRKHILDTDDYQFVTSLLHRFTLLKDRFERDNRYGLTWKYKEYIINSSPKQPFDDHEEFTLYVDHKLNNFLLIGCFEYFGESNKIHIICNRFSYLGNCLIGFKEIILEDNYFMDLLLTN